MVAQKSRGPLHGATLGVPSERGHARTFSRSTAPPPTPAREMMRRARRSLSWAVATSYAACGGSQAETASRGAAAVVAAAYGNLPVHPRRDVGVSYQRTFGTRASPSSASTAPPLDLDLVATVRVAYDPSCVDARRFRDFLATVRRAKAAPPAPGAPPRSGEAVIEEIVRSDGGRAGCRRRKVGGPGDCTLRHFAAPCRRWFISRRPPSTSIPSPPQTCPRPRHLRTR